jgi:tetratricopeptide (TPR) repeat protein
LKPDTPEALFDLGNTYLKMGQYDKAIAQYEKTVTIDKTYWFATNNIGLIKYEQGDTSGAIAKWQEALTVDSKQAEPLLALAVALYHEGKIDEALKDAEAALAIDVSYADLEFLKENLWGDRLLKDTKVLLDRPEIQAVIPQFKQQQEAAAQEQ